MTANGINREAAAIFLDRSPFVRIQPATDIRMPQREGDVVMNPEIEFSNLGEVHPPLGLYSHVVALPAGAELFLISGQVGVKPDGSVDVGIEGQAEQVFANLFAVLQAHGLAAINIVKLTVFIVAGQDLGDLRNARLKYLGSHRPASTAVYVSRLAAPEWLVEVEAIAARPKV